MAADRTWPFVGREPLIVAVLDRLDAGENVILGGAAGLGKTRVAGEVAARMLKKRVLVHRVAASPASAHLPLAPFASLIANDSASDVVGAVLRSLGADGKAGAGDPVLVVDDMHLLDDASAAVLQQVMLSGFVRLLATVRMPSKLPVAVTRWQQEANVTRIDVARLTDEDITTIVEHALHGTLDGRSHLLLTNACAGNPMYARELVEGSLEAGTLCGHGSLWSFDGEMAATPLLEEVVLARLAPLRADERDALELLAVGGQLPYRLVNHIVGSDPIERLERKQVVQAIPAITSQPMQLDVAHPLYRELTRARLGAVARMRIYGRLAGAADAMQATGEPAGPRAEAIRSAMWHIRGEVEISVELLLAAARASAAMGDSQLAAELAEVSYRRGGSIRAALLASWSLAETGRHDEAVEILKDAAAHGADPWKQAAMRLRVAEELWWTSRQQAARQYLDESALPPGPWHDLLEAQRGVFAVLDGNLPEAWSRCRPLINHTHVSVRLVAAIAVGNAGIWGDGIDEAMQVCASAISDIRTVAAGGDDDEVGLLGNANLYRAIKLAANLHGGEVAAATESAQAGYAITVHRPSIQARAGTAMLYGQALAIRGELAKSCRYLAEAERGWASVGLEGFAGWCASGLALAQAEQGLSESEATICRADTYDVSGFGIQQVERDIARAWIAAVAGERAGASAILTKVIAQAAALEQWTRVAEAWHAAARLDLLALVSGVEHWQRPTARLAAARFDFVHALYSGAAADLEAASTTFETLGAMLFAAEAAAAASTAARTHGATKQVVRLDALSSRLLNFCGPTRTPLLIGRRRGVLSSREDEVARLAAKGLSNRQIADQLVVSERTVENHIYRIFIKLGIEARDQIAGALATE